MEDILVKLLGIFVLSFIVERFLEVLSAIYEGIIILRQQQRTEEEKKIKKTALCAVVGVVIGIVLSGVLKIGILHTCDLVPDANYWWHDYILTGLAIGGGTEPIHSLVAFLGYKKEEEKK